MGRPRTRSAAGLLAAAAGWAAVVPYLGRAIGLRLDVPARIEVIDHVVPAVVVLLAAAGLALQRPRPGTLGWSVAAGATFLAGSWITTTHAALLGEAAMGRTPWAPAALHFSAGVPVLLAGLVMLLLPLARPPGR